MAFQRPKMKRRNQNIFNFINRNRTHIHSDSVSLKSATLLKHLTDALLDCDWFFDLRLLIRWIIKLFDANYLNLTLTELFAIKNFYSIFIQEGHFYFWRILRKLEIVFRACFEKASSFFWIQKFSKKKPNKNSILNQEVHLYLLTFSNQI